MSLEDLGNIGEVVAAVGVIISLIYLAVQIRQNTSTVRAAAFQDVVGNSASFLKEVFRDAELTRIWISGSEDLNSLTGVDRGRFHYLIVTFFRQVENTYNQTRKGLLKFEEWEGIRESVFDGIARPGMRQWWESNAFRFNSGFREFVEDELRRRADQDNAKPPSLAIAEE
jgi:hypothetical protein